MKTTRNLLLLAVILLVSFSSQFNVVFSQGEQLKIDQLMAKEGDSQSGAFCIKQDSKGELWIGSGENGLRRFNSKAELFEQYVYEEQDSMSLFGNVVNCIFEDKNGGLWIGTNRGLCQFNRQEGNFIRYSNSIIGEESRGVLSIVSADNNMLWLATKQMGVLLFDTERGQVLKQYVQEDGNENSLSSNFVKIVLYDSAGYLWAITNKNVLNRLEKNSEDKFTRFMLNPPSKTGIARRIAPAFMRTWWFRGVLVLILIAIAYALYRMRVQDFKDQRARLTQNENIRILELEKVNTELKKQKKAIESSCQNIETISKIGTDISAGLSLESITEVTYNGLVSIMEIPLFSIGLYDSAGEKLVFKSAKALGETLPDFSYNISDSGRVSVWCFKNQQAVLIHDFSKEYQKYVSNQLIPKRGKPPRSLIYIPLNVQNKRLGVMSVQSHIANVYSPYHQNILKIIGDYVASALNNIEA